MKQEYKTLLLGLFAVGLLDSLGSIASRELDFNYTLLSPISFLIYGATAFFTTRQNGLKTGIIYAAILGLFDTTIGWKISMILNANTGGLENQTTIGLWIMIIIIGVGVAGFWGLLGGGLAKMIKTKNPDV